MHDYNTILGVIELRLSKVSYDSVQKRYRIGRSGIALIMNRYKDSGLSLDDLRQMPASKVVDLIYPKENLRHKDIPLPDFEKIQSVYGDSMVTLIDRILRSSKHEEQAYNSCAGVLHSCKDVPHRLVQEAAEKCVEANACKYSYFKKVLSMVQNNHSSSAINGTGKLPSHTNIRGKEAYK